MKSKILKSTNRISWFARLTGAAPEILEKCSATCRNAFNYVGMTLLFTAIVSAAVIGFAVSTYSFKNILMFPLIFVAWCVFIYLFDRLVVMSDSAVTKWVRTCAIIVLALFNSFVWDTLTLKDDIMAQIKKEYNGQIASVNEKYDGLVAPVQNRIDSIQNRNDEINAAKRSYIDSLQAEGRGFGGSHKYGVATVYKNLEGLKDEYKSLAESDVAANNAIITDRKKEITGINVDREREIAAIVKPGESGLMEQVRKMHQIVFVQGTITEKIFFAIWFGLFCFLESLPVLAKIVFQKRIIEYFKGQDAEQENSEKAFDTRKLNDWTVMQSEMQFDLQLRLSKVGSDSLLHKVELDKQGIRDRLKILEDFLSELEKIDAELRSIFPDQYAEYVKPEVDKACEYFMRSMNLNS